MMEEEHARLILSICTHVIKRRLIRVLVESRRSSSLLLPRSQPRMLPASSSLVRRRRALLAASLAFGCYAYHQRWLSRLRASLAQLGDAAGALREALASGSLCLNTLSSDLAAFLCAEDEVAVPASLRQLLRLLQCDEAQCCRCALERRRAACPGATLDWLPRTGRERCMLPAFARRGAAATFRTKCGEPHQGLFSTKLSMS